MKKLLLILGVIWVCTFSFGETVYLPEDTKEVISCDYSSGGGDKVIVYIEVLIKDLNGDYHMYSSSKGSLSGFLGLGRFNIPEHFKFVIKNGLKNKIEVDWQ